MIDEPTSEPASTDATEALLSFLQGRDVECPDCRYNLRNLTRPVCPECEQELRLTVGLKRLGFGYFIMAIIPSAFSGIAAILYTGLVVTVQIKNGLGAMPWWIWVIGGFGWLSGLFGLALARDRSSFVRQPIERQRLVALLSWLVHVLAFLAVLASALP